MSAYLGDHEQALRCLEEAAARGTSVPLSYVKIAVVLDPLRDDPRFQAILEGMGLAD